MLKFRFRKKEMRRRSNSCPNLDSINSDHVGNGQTMNVNKHASCCIEDKSDQESDNNVPSPTKKERLFAQRSIRRFKKKEKEQQENVEKNLLSADDFWRKLDSLKEWLHDEHGNKEVDNMQSPKLRSHFKKFIKLWNKRKLPLKYYKNCCVDAETESSSADNIPANHNSQSPSAPFQGQSAFSFDFLHQPTTLKDLPSYHHFPFVDETSEQTMLSATSSVFSTSSASFKEAAGLQVDDNKVVDNHDSPFSTFGKSTCDPHTSTSFMAKQLDVRASKRKGLKSKDKNGPLSPTTTSPQKFATISRSTPASCVFKSSSPQIHAVVSPTCPYPAPFAFPTTASSEIQGVDCERDTKTPSPAYMCVQDAIPFDSISPSPKYWQVGFDNVFEDEQSDSHYCSLSPFLSNKKSSNHGEVVDFSSRLSRNSSNLSRRRSKSMEDIYAVPSRLLMTMDVHKKVTSSIQEDAGWTVPPVPVKKFTPTSSVVSLGDALPGKLNSPLCLESTESRETLRSSSTMDKGPEGQSSSSSSMFSSDYSLSTDTGYLSGRFGESCNSFGDTSIDVSRMKSSTGFKTHKSVSGIKRRSEEHETNVDDMESPKKNKPALSRQNNSKLNEIMNTVCLDKKDNLVTDDETVEMSITDFSKNLPKSKMSDKLPEDSPSFHQQTHKKSILTGSLNPTTRTPKTDRNLERKKEKDRLSIIQIQVLDKSPTFPRRKVKRRSSGLVVTPGKGLTFGNKSNSRMAVSSPRRVSFAKNVKNCNDENVTPARRRSSSSSASKMSVRGSVAKNDMSRQCQDKAEFESFWSGHEKNNKPNSPVKGGNNNSKPWSPSKCFSPTKNTLVSRNSSSLQSNTNFNCSNVESSNQDDEKGSFIKSLSPKKLFSSRQKNSSSSSLLAVEDSSRHCDNSCINELGSTIDISKPKSILKVKNNVTSPALHQEQRQEAEKFQSNKMNNFHTSHQSSSRTDVFNLDYCRSPPKLGVASLKAAQFAAAQNMSSLPRSKQRMLFQATMNPNTLSTEHTLPTNTSEHTLSTNTTGHTLPTNTTEQTLPAYSTEHIMPTDSSFDTHTKWQNTSPNENDSHYLEPPNNSLRQRQGGHDDEVYSYNQQVFVDHDITTQDHPIDVDRDLTTQDHTIDMAPKDHTIDVDPDISYDTLCKLLPPPPSYLLDETFEDVTQTPESICPPIICENSAESVEENVGRNEKNTSGETDSDVKNGNKTNKWDADFGIHDVDANKCNKEQVDALSCLGKQLAGWNDGRVSPKSIPSFSMTTVNQDRCRHNQSDKVDSIPPMQIGKQADATDTIQQQDCSKIIQETTLMSPNIDDASHLQSSLDAGHGVPYVERSDCLVGGDSNLPVTSDKSNRQLSQTVLERIKSFRSSPKVEENDGWITERRRSSRRNKSKSFRNSPNQSLIDSPSPLQFQDSLTNTELQSREDSMLNSSLDAPILGQIQEETFHGKLLDTKEACGSYLGINIESFHKLEDERETCLTSRTVRSTMTTSNDDISHVDKGYETESRSNKGDRDKCGGRGDFEEESVSSMSSDFGNCGKSYTSSSPIYDVPRTGIHAAIPVKSNISPCANDSQMTDKISRSHNHITINTNERNDNSVYCDQPYDNAGQSSVARDNKIPSDKSFVMSTGGSSVQFIPSIEEDKENTSSPPKPLKPKPLVRPKPSVFPKPGTTLHQSPTSSLSPKVRNATHSIHSTTKRRSSLVKKESLSIRDSHRPSIYSSFKANSNSNQITRPVVRKRSSISKREETLKGKSLQNSPTTRTTLRMTHKMESNTNTNTPSRRRRSSLEKVSRRSSTGVSAGPEHTSFAQRKKFFQQLHTSTNVVSSSSSSSSSTVMKSKLSSVKSFNSFPNKSQPKPAPKPVVRQKPEAIHQLNP